MGFGVLATVLALAGGGAAGAGDYPAWRGSARDGVIPDGPALTVPWPADGPAFVWKTERIPDGGRGGYGSVAVAGGRAYLYYAREYSLPIPERILGREGLRNLGWFEEELPAELARAVEEARLGEDRATRKGDDLRIWIEGWVEARVPDAKQGRRLREILADRIRRGKAAVSLEILARLETIEGRVFPTEEAIDGWFAEHGIAGDAREAIRRAIPRSVRKANDNLVCLDAATGAQRWLATWETDAGGGDASSTPCIAEGRCYVAGCDGDVTCVDAATGAQLWRCKAAEGGGTVHSSVLCVDGAAVVLAGRLVALRSDTGEVLWRQEKAGGRENSPVAWRAGGRTIVIANTGDGVKAVDLRDGTLLWSVPGGGRSTAAVAGDGMVVLSNQRDVGLSAYRLSPEMPERRWSIPDLTDGAASPIIREGRVFAVTEKKAACVDLESGSIVWEGAVRGRGHTSPILAGDTILALIGRELHAIRAGGAAFESLASFKIPACEYASPALAGGRLYLRLNDAVACYDLARGAGSGGGG
ncbi:MAG: PQQ-like beta-propeller repeat protein [Planctomycetes bacterium]|nr:PQQ-like beta-propeller repeat protein [Planctomycetota bacterium]